MRRRSGIRAVAVGLGLAAVAACGKKGPPLAPLVPIPAAVEQIAAERLGRDVYVSVTIPAANVDAFEPADLGRIEIYGYTGRSAPSRARWVEVATLVATIPVAEPPPRPGQPERPAAIPEPPPGAPEQGEQATVLDRLTPEELVQGKEPVDPRSAIRDPESAGELPAAARRPAGPLNRYYIAVPFSRRGRPGPPGGVAEFPLVAMPDAPPALEAAYSERAIHLSWEPSAGLLGFLLERALPEEPLPFVEDVVEQPETTDAATDEPAGPVMYHVYREVPPGPSTPPGPRDATWRAELPAPVTPAPLPTLAFTDTLEFERPRCYTVRAVRGVGPTARIGDASPPACLTPVDVFEPAPPQAIVTVASEGAISLAWEPNTELDLAGYIVLRADAPGDTLRPITAAPVVQAGYRDEAVTPGTRYVYAVVAVDNRFPVPNMSPVSATVEETAR